MKKVLVCLLLILGMLFLVGCNEENDSDKNENGNTGNIGDNGSAENGESNIEDGENNTSGDNENNNAGGINEETHEHTFDYLKNSETHLKQFTCGCPSSDVEEAHTDKDFNNECDVCSYSITKVVNGLVMGTYYLPYDSMYDPISITFYKSGRCMIDFSNEDKEPYRQNYWLQDGCVYIDIDGAPKVHVFRIFENALVFDPKLSTANLWDSMYSMGPVVYFLPDVSEEEMLGTVVMANMGLTSIPTIDRIYKKYDSIKEYFGITNDVYAFMANIPATQTPHSDKVLGTEYTFTYSDSREILIYTQGWLMTLNKAFDRGLITDKILGEINEDHRNCEIAHSYDEGIIISGNDGEKILYTCHICSATKTVSLPNDFSFSLTYGFDLYYDSKTGYLENGYNYELGTKCETTLILDHNELMNIYRILYNGSLLEINDDFYATDRIQSPSYTIKISYIIDGEAVEFRILGASGTTYSKWDVYSEFCYAYEKVVRDFITSSEEYKALPPNHNVYD